jgi:hypothetical protein
MSEEPRIASTPKVAVAPPVTERPSPPPTLEREPEPEARSPIARLIRLIAA